MQWQDMTVGRMESAGSGPQFFVCDRQSWHFTFFCPTHLTVCPFCVLHPADPNIDKLPDDFLTQHFSCPHGSCPKVAIYRCLDGAIEPEIVLAERPSLATQRMPQRGRRTAEAHARREEIRQQHTHIASIREGVCHCPPLGALPLWSFSSHGGIAAGRAPVPNAPPTSWLGKDSPTTAPAEW